MKRKLQNLLVAIVLALVWTASTSSVAEAALYPNLKELMGKKATITHMKLPKSERYLTDSIFIVSKGKVTNIKSSNTKILKASFDQDTRRFTLSPKAIGKAKLTYTYKGKNYKVVVKVVKRSNPVKKVTIAGKDITGQLAKSNYATTVMLGIENFTNKRVSVTPSSGWAVQAIRANKNGKTLKVGNGKAIKADPCNFFTIILKQKKTGALLTLQIVGSQKF